MHHRARGTYQAGANKAKQHALKNTPIGVGPSMTASAYVTVVFLGVDCGEQCERVIQTQENRKLHRCDHGILQLGGDEERYT